MNQLYPNWDNVQSCTELDELVLGFLGWNTHPLFPKLWVRKDTPYQISRIPEYSSHYYEALHIWKLMPEAIYKGYHRWHISFHAETGEWYIWKDFKLWTKGDLPLAICVAFCKAKYEELCEKSGV